MSDKKEERIQLQIAEYFFLKRDGNPYPGRIEIMSTTIAELKVVI